MEFEHIHKIALWAFLGAVVFGAIASRTQFCTMGAISDWVNMGSKTRFRVWMLAIGIAIIGAQLLHIFGYLDLNESIYLSTNFTWLGHIVGGFLFGIGMTLASGCGQRTLVRLGGGNLKSLVVLLVMGIIAYMTLRGLLALIRLEITTPTTWDLSAFNLSSQGLPDMISTSTGLSPAMSSILLIILIAGGLIFYALKDRQVWSEFNNLLAGVGIGLLVVGAWYLTGVVGFDDFDPIPLEGPTFVAPVGNTLTYAMTFTGATINFGIAITLGLIVGAFLYSIITKTFRIESFTHQSDFINHLSGAALMGFGGVTALGCTIGQGITGLSTLAVGSIVTILFIMLGSAMTMKTQYYLYDEQGWGHAIRSSCSDFNPLRLRNK